MKKILFALATLLFASCMPDNDLDDQLMTIGGGVVFINEGNFNAGNGSLSFFSYDSTAVYNDIFSNVNGRPLGDVPNSVNYSNGKLYVVVNNSGKIEELDPLTFESRHTISGLISPRNMTIANGKAYVSSLWSDSITVLNIVNSEISKYINLNKSSEALAGVGNRLFASNWMNGNQVFVINTFTDQLVDSIEVGREPESMAVDRNLKLWILCTGGWQKLNNPELIVINTSTLEIEKRFVFPLESSPSCLKIDGSGEFLYYLDNGINKMSIEATTLPDEPFIPKSNQNFYKIGINPVDNGIFATDVVDYVHNGFLHIYDKEGQFIATHETGIIPGEMTFRLTISK